MNGRRVNLVRKLLASFLLLGCSSDPATAPSPDAGAADVSISDVGADAPDQNGTRPKLVWAKAVDVGRPAALAVDGKDHALVGEWTTNIDSTTNHIDGLDANGVVLFSTPAVGPEFDANAAGATLGGGLAQTSSDTWSIDVAGLDPAGKLLYQHRFGSEVSIHFGDVALDADGNAFFSGDYSAPIDFGAGAEPSTAGNVFVIKTTSAGAPVWIKHFAKLTGGPQIATDPSGGLLLAGTAKGEDLGGGAMTGPFVAALKADGTFAWSVVGNAEGYLQTLVADPSGDGGVVALVGKGVSAWGGKTFPALGENDFVLVRFDAAGKTRWLQRVTDDDVTWARRFAISKGGDVAVALHAQGTVDLGAGPLARGGRLAYLDSCVLGRYDASGKPRFTTRYGDDGKCAFGGVAFTQDDSLLVAGEVEGSTDFGGSTISTSTSKPRQSFLVKIAK